MTVVKWKLNRSSVKYLLLNARSHIWSNFMKFLCEVQLAFVTAQISAGDEAGI